MVVYCYTFERNAVIAFVILLVSTSVNLSGTCTRISPAAQSRYQTHDRSVKEVAAVCAVVTKQHSEPQRRQAELG